MAGDYLENSLLYRELDIDEHSTDLHVFYIIMYLLQIPMADLRGQRSVFVLSVSIAIAASNTLNAFYRGCLQRCLSVLVLSVSRFSHWEIIVSSCFRAIMCGDSERLDVVLLWSITPYCNAEDY